MPRLAVPRLLEFAPTLEKAATGKIQTQDLRHAGPTAATWARDSIGYIVPR